MSDVPAVELAPVPVWDLPLRLFHWSLLAAVATAAVTGFLLLPPWLNLHLVAGSIIIALLLFRFVWGFTGSTFSRFASFVFSPRETFRHAMGLLRGETAHHDGHNPVGAAMIFALLLVLITLSVTGLVALGGTDKQGPLKALVSYATGSGFREIHEIAAWILLALIAGHVSGIAIESARSRINLARAMVTGVKPSTYPVTIERPDVARFAAGAVALAVFAGGAAYAGWRQPAAGVPVAALDATYAKDCGDCHIPFHPSLRGKAAWAEIMANLSDHFGEDASLSAEETAQIAAYLEANAAEAFDTRAANVLRGEKPLAITETPFWTRRHAELAPAVFQQKNVGTKSNCEACHADARTGLFMPQAIQIPKE